MANWTWQNWLLIGDTAFIALYAVMWLLGQAKLAVHNAALKIAAATNTPAPYVQNVVAAAPAPAAPAAGPVVVNPPQPAPAAPAA